MNRKPVTNDEVIKGLLKDFLADVRMEKKAYVEVAPKLPTSETNKVEENPASGASAAESRKDHDAMIGGISATASAAQNSEKDEVEVKTPISPDTLGSDQAATPEAAQKVSVTQVTDNAAAPSELAKAARAERLSNRILSTINSMLEAQNGVQKQAAQAPAAQAPAAQAPGFSKEASDAAYGYAVGYEWGIAKKAQDMAETLASGVVQDPAMAEAILNDVAATDPEAVMPEEAMSEEDAAITLAEEQLDPETKEILDQLADVMAAEGVTPEDLAQAAEVVGQLQANGVAPEEIVQAVTEAAGEEQAAEAAPEMAPEEVEAKLAAESRGRVDAVKRYLAAMRG